MQIRLEGKCRILIGAAAAAAIGIGIGAWMKPSLAESPAPDPYANLVITAPSAEQASAVQQTDWVSYPTQWTEAPRADIWPTAAVPPAADVQPADWSLPPEPASLTKDELDQALPPPDPLDEDAAPPAAVLKTADAAPAARLQPGDWDVPTDAYARAPVQVAMAK